MTSRLAAQLAQSASLNAALFKSASSRANRRDSYIFTAQEASRHDPESIHGLAYNAFLQLQALDPSLGQYEDSVFSQAAKAQDRTLLNQAENDRLNVVLNAFLLHLSAHLFLESTGRVVEWLVRHFRVQEFNVDGVLACFLPYHDSPLFARMVQILHVKTSRGQSMWSFLEPIQKTGQPLARESLLVAMGRDVELVRFIVSLLPTALDEDCVHRPLVGFYTATLLEFLKKQSTIDENLLTILLPALSQLLQFHSNDVSLAAYMLFVSLARKSNFTSGALSTILTAMAKNFRATGSAAHLITALVAICASQGELEIMPAKLVSSLARIQDVETWLAESSSISGSEKLLRPLINHLAQNLHIEEHARILGSILCSSTLPETVIQLSCVAVARQLSAVQVESTDSGLASARVKELGAILQQRYPSLFADAVRDVRNATADTAVQQTLDRATASLTATGDAATEESAIVLAAYSADETVRTTGTRQILTALSDNRSLPPETLQALRDALISRIGDSDFGVTEIVYSASTQLIDIFGADELFAAVKQAASSDVSRKHLLLHLNFIMTVFAPRHASYKDRIIYEIFMPHLLFTKAHSKTATSVWTAVLSSVEFARVPLLRGCSGILAKLTKAHSAGNASQLDHETANAEIAAQFADNIIASDDYQEYVRIFMDSLATEVRATQLFASLVVHALVARVSGEHQVELAGKVLDFLQKVDAQSSASTGAVTENEAAAQVFTRPNSAKTLVHLRAALLLEVSKVAQPLSVKLDLLCDTDAVIESDMRGVRFVNLLRRTYAFTNRGSTVSSYSAAAMKNVFGTLKQNVLLFLAGIWSDNESTAPTRLAALRHGCAYLRAQAGGDILDYQAVVPSLLRALQDPDHRLRFAGIDCLKAMDVIQSTGRTPKAVYAYDAAYGSHSGPLQYLEWSDLVQYVRLLVSHADEVQLDPMQLASVHEVALNKTKGEGKKAASFKDRIICFILSHVLAWRSLSARASLLQLLQNVQSGVKLQLLLPLLRRTVDAVGQKKTSELLVVHSGTLSVVELLIRSYDRTSISALNSADEEAWKVLKLCLHIQLDTDVGRVIFTTAVSALRPEFVSNLKRERQLELFREFIALSTSSDRDYAVLKQSLVHSLTDTSMMIELITALRPLDDPAHRAAKRPRVEDTVNDTELQLRQLTTLIEAISSKSIKGDFELVSVLLETLGRLRSAPSLSGIDVDYTEQLVLVVIMSAASAVHEGVSVSTNALRIDLIVDLIRVTENPQTFRQALLTIAGLARFSRDSVLHNVMPIFTFMGSTVLQSDDAHSFSVIQKTIDNIVPVMAASLKEGPGSVLDLYIRSRPFLRVFTDASMHIPRHRRSKFFIHLVNVLGRADFLAPVCILLVDKVASRVVKQKDVDLPATFALPLACIQRSRLEDSLSVFLEVLEECRRLCKRLEDPKQSEPATFLDAPLSSDTTEHPLSPHAVIVTQVRALLLFVATALVSIKATSSEDAELDMKMQSLMSHLLGLGTRSTTVGTAEIRETALATLDKAMKVVSVANFAAAVQDMLSSTDPLLQLAALKLVPRLKSVTAKARKAIGAVMVAIIGRVIQLLQESSDGNVRVEALQALQIIAGTAMSAEEGPLGQGVQALLDFTRTASQSERLHVVTILKILIRKLGPRLIPTIKAVVEYCASQVEAAATPGYDAALCIEAFDVLTGLVGVLPNFIGPYLSRVLEACLNPSLVLPDDLQAARQAVLRTIAKRIPAKSLLPTLYKLWDSQTLPPGDTTAPTVQFMAPFFDLLQRALRIAERADVLTSLRDTFKFFLDVFDVRRTHFAANLDEAFVAVEGTSISAFMQVVVKLNETTFKPFFRRLYDWALVKQTGTVSAAESIARQVVFYRIMSALLDQFKGIITPYMSILLDHTKDLLGEYTSGALDDGELWGAVVGVLRRSFEFDEGAFWRDNTMTKIMPALVDQIDACPQLSIPPHAPFDPAEAIASCLAAMAQAASDDVAKALNLAVWMKARSDSVKAKLVMLKVAQAVWESDGERLNAAGYTAETVSFLVECLEDPSEAVENAARAFQKQLTQIAGPLEGLI